jgi:hypothetical protein
VNDKRWAKLPVDAASQTISNTALRFQACSVGGEGALGFTAGGRFFCFGFGEWRGNIVSA